MNVNTQTGEYGMKLTDQAGVATGVAIAAAIATGGASGATGSATQNLTNSMITSGTSALITSGFEYDADGATHGFNLSGRHGEMAVLGALTSAAATGAGGALGSRVGGGDAFMNGVAKGAISTATSTALNTMMEFQKMKHYGAQYSNYAALTRTDLSSGLGMAASVLAGGYQERVKSELDHRGTPIDRANQTDRSHRIMDSIWGAWESTKEWLSGAVSKVKGWFGGGYGDLALNEYDPYTAGLAPGVMSDTPLSYRSSKPGFFEGVWNGVKNTFGLGKGGFWERVGNWWNDRGWVTDDQLTGIKNRMVNSLRYAINNNVRQKMIEQAQATGLLTEADIANAIEYSYAVESEVDLLHYGTESRNNGIDFLNDNRQAYLAGKQAWESGKFNNQAYDNVQLVQDGGEYFKVYRKYDKTSGIFSLVGSESITANQYNASNQRVDTYCNLAANAIGQRYHVPNMQNLNGNEYNANAMYDNLESGLYNDPNLGSFYEVSPESAEQWANHGGFSTVAYKANGGIGHIATLTGGYGGNGQINKNNLNIFQAGNSYGAMLYRDAFTVNAQTKFYIFVPANFNQSGGLR
jgi:hypothetical protein